MDNNPFSLKGKIALITGGSRGIGKQTALGFAHAGADIAIASRKLPDLEAAVAEIKTTGRKAIGVSAHIGRLEQIDELVKKVVAEYGRIDILVNNAGTNPVMSPALDVEERAWDSIMNLNLKGLFFLSQAVARVMKEKGGGKIINVSSMEGYTPGLLPVYSISKAGVIMATKVMAHEWAKYNIRVNAIAPGLINTPFSEALWSNEEYKNYLLSRTPLKRLGEADEMVGALIYLASDASSYVTGVTIPIDGGATL